MAANKKQVCITMRTTKSEYQTLKELSEGIGVPVSDLLRYTLSISWETLCQAEIKDIEKQLIVPFNYNVPH